MFETRKGYVVYPDTNGLLHNSLDITQTQPHWVEAAEALVSYFQKTQHPNIHSVYLRGSAACGTAIDSFSDIDFYVLTYEPIAAHDVITIDEFAKSLNEEYPFITKFDVGYHTKKHILDSKEGTLLKVTALCMYGEDISGEISAPRVGKDMTLSISQIESDIVKIKGEVASGVYEDPKKLRQLCIWVSKKLIRSGFEIVAEQEQCFTRDLLVCKDIFCKYYPEKQPEMETAIDLFLNQTTNVVDVTTLLDTFGAFLVQEWKTT